MCAQDEFCRHLPVFFRFLRPIRCAEYRVVSFRCLPSKGHYNSEGFFLISRNEQKLKSHFCTKLRIFTKSKLFILQKATKVIISFVLEGLGWLELIFLSKIAFLSLWRRFGWFQWFQQDPKKLNLKSTSDNVILIGSAVKSSELILCLFQTLQNIMFL